MTLDDATPCGSCGGRGWKFLTYRRSHEPARSGAEAAPVLRARVECLSCRPAQQTTTSEREPGDEHSRHSRLQGRGGQASRAC
jgi:hypothetical protein